MVVNQQHLLRPQCLEFRLPPSNLSRVIIYVGVFIQRNSFQDFQVIAIHSQPQVCSLSLSLNTNDLPNDHNIEQVTAKNALQ